MMLAVTPDQEKRPAADPAGRFRLAAAMASPTVCHTLAGHALALRQSVL
jgi:hypothetical protein